MLRAGVVKVKTQVDTQVNTQVGTLVGTQVGTQGSSSLETNDVFSERIVVISLFT